MNSLGICLGASTIGMVRLSRTAGNIEIVDSRTRVHDGQPKNVLNEMLNQVADIEKIRICATGRNFKNRLTLSTISEPEAVERACSHIMPADHPYRVIISAGGETIMVYHLDDDGRIQGIHTGNKCASGTGEFFLQQLGRMAITLKEVGRMEMPDKYYKVSGRCSVFCKSDCTHALNKGMPKSEVVAGLSRMMAGKILELLKKLPATSVMMIGGCTKNLAMVHYLRQEIADLFIPAEAPWFEALGAGLRALEYRTVPFAGSDKVFIDQQTNRAFLPPLTAYKSRVEFKQQPRGTAEPRDRTILGLDVGSTTTKGVIMRRRDKAILAADYLRTDGDPIEAARQVYKSLAQQIDVPIFIEGLGVTGSGRQIAGLHGMTAGVINEIIAHATGAVHFDPGVDTIFEIGGQDAKYTYLTNGVPSDYAMNEACSAGTGSFLEEAAKESLGLKVTEIGDTAFKSGRPPNFNDQCAAFIGSDIKGAVQDNIPLQDIVAGLVYSICMNYTNRVKGNRPVGEKIFMQGGVCYNNAVPVAMAALCGKQIIVPPEPGLMGAFGVALEIERRLEQGLLAPANFDLDELRHRTVTYEKPFTCSGGKECDRGCEISRIRINDKVYPFGGICNRYDNIVHKRKIDSSGYNLAVKREHRLFRDLVPHDAAASRPTIGMNRSFLVNTYFPFFNRLFAGLGYRLILPDTVDPLGIDQQGAAFCYPAELAHGYAATLLQQKPDFYFLPHIKGIQAGPGTPVSCTCVILQSEPFYLATAFPEFIRRKTLTPTLDFSRNMADNQPVFMEIARRLGAAPSRIKPAIKAAMADQENFFTDIRRMGDEMLSLLEQDKKSTGIILFGRPYNSFTSVANKGIPAKFASRGIPVIPFDMLPTAREELDPEYNMYWGMGSMILKGALYARRQPQLFATYITNFSCGPDSFLVTYFRDIMGRKPSLTLELDSHTADAGLETRIEAFLDIVQYYRQVRGENYSRPRHKSTFTPAAVEFNRRVPGIRTSKGQWLPLTDDRVKVIIPAMGRFGTPLLAKSFAGINVRAIPLPPADKEMLKLGRGHSSCKECLPLQTTIGSLYHYLKQRRNGEVTAYFMASAQGPCRFGQYQVFSKRFLLKQRIADVTVLSPTSVNGYGGLGDRFLIAAWRALVIGDIFDEMWSTILAGANDRKQGLEILHAEHRAILEVIHKGWPTIAAQLEKSAKALRRIVLKRPYHEIPKLSLVGEIYVRHDPISLQNLIERLAEMGFIVRTAQNSEWIKYVDWLSKEGIEGKQGIGCWVRRQIKGFYDIGIRKKLAPSGLFFFEDHVDVESVIKAGKKFISPNVTCESILTIGSALHEILHPACGIISIGPFGCMPSRVAEAILSEKFTTWEKRELTRQDNQDRWGPILASDRKFPFLAIETDGNAFPQVIEARLEAFCLQAKRLAGIMLDCAAPK